MKATRKFRPRSFISQVAGSQRGEQLTKLAGSSRAAGPENDHDAAHPAHGQGATPNDHDS